MPQAVDIELSDAHRDEPTWEVLHPRSGRVRRRADRRAKSVLAIAVAAAVLVNAGAAWTYWQVRQSASTAAAGTPVEMRLHSRSDADHPLVPGGTGGLTVTLTNDNDFPVRIATVTGGAGTVVADDEHRDRGCRVTGVRLARTEFAVSWRVARNTVGAFTIPAALTRDTTGDDACDGATFTVPIRVSGVSG